MSKKNEYKILPETGRARALLALGMLVRLLLIVGNFVWFLSSGFPAGPSAFFHAFDKIHITYQNETGQPVAVYVDDRLKTTVRAGSSATASSTKIAWWTSHTIEARDAAGRTLFAVEIDGDDLERAGYRVVIEKQLATPTTSPVPTR